MICINSISFATESMYMRASTDTALARGWPCSVQPHCVLNGRTELLCDMKALTRRESDDEFLTPRAKTRQVATEMAE